MHLDKLLFLLSCVFALGICAAMPGQAVASLAASDDASHTDYDDGWGADDDGDGSFGVWSFGSGGGGFIASGTSVDVSGEAFGVYGNSPSGIGDAIRSLTGGDLLVGQTFSIDMDNQDVTASAVGFGLQNMAGDNLFEFFFAFGSPGYKVRKGVSGVDTVVDTSTLFTSDGLSLSFTLTDADSFSLTIDPLGAGSTETVTGDLLPVTDQGIQKLRLFNANSTGPDVFFNSLAISAVPEPSAFLFGGLVFSTFGLNSLRRKRRS